MRKQTYIFKNRLQRPVHHSFLSPVCHNILRRKRIFQFSQPFHNKTQQCTALLTLQHGTKMYWYIVVSYIMFFFFAKFQPQLTQAHFMFFVVRQCSCLYCSVSIGKKMDVAFLLHIQGGSLVRVRKTGAWWLYFSCSSV